MTKLSIMIFAHRDMGFFAVMYFKYMVG